MTDNLKIGLVIADDDEYIPFLNFCLENKGEKFEFYKRQGCFCELCENGRKISLDIICSGVGKVNAAAAAMFFVQNGCDILLSAGLSGGISGVARGETVVGTRYLEHDFDLTCIGYDFAQKPGQEYIYDADKLLCNCFINTLGCKSGTMVTGDCFVSNDELRKLLKDRFSAVCCDMETASIAYIGYLTNKPFVAIRRVSDDAGNDAFSSYSQMNSAQNGELCDCILSCLRAILNDNNAFSGILEKRNV